MNNYPIWWDTTLTIFNRYEDTQTQLVKWYKTVISGCFWKYTGDKVTINETTLETNNTIARIRKDKRFLEKYEWIKVPNDLMGNYFTIGAGDILIKGEVDDDIDEYKAGKRSTDIVQKYKDMQGCMIVEEYANNTGAGRCNEHYYVKGV
jgi:hypothetical protein